MTLNQYSEEDEGKRDLRSQNRRYDIPDEVLAEGIARHPVAWLILTAPKGGSDSG